MLSVPSLVKLTQDGGYLSRVTKAYKELKNLKMVTRMHLLKENTMESDELAEVVNNLASLVEDYKTVAGDSDQSSSEEDHNDMDDGDDY